MRNKFFIFSVAFMISAQFATAEDFISPGIEIGHKFQRSQSTAYIHCIQAAEFKDPGFSNYTFKIMAKPGTPDAGKEVGKISVAYRQNKSPVSSLEHAVEIGSLDVDAQYRRHGYAEAAIRTVLGIFRSEKRANLTFDRFWLTVGMNNDRTAARHLYEKVGFTVEETMPHIGYQNMHLAR